MNYFYIRYIDYRNIYYPHVPLVKEDYYRHIWNTCYNIGTKNPRVDKCDTCTSLEQKITNAKAAGRVPTEEEAQLNEHQEKASVAYRHLKDARNKKNGNKKIGSYFA